MTLDPFCRRLYLFSPLCYVLSFLSSIVAAESPYEVEWGRQVGTADHDLSHEVAVDPQGNVLLAWTFDGPPVGENSLRYDTALNKYDPDGNLLWNRTFDSDRSDLAYALSVDDWGNSYFGGVSGVADEGDAAEPHQDAFLKKIDADGRTLWERSFGTSGHEAIHDIEVGQSGDVYVVGTTTGSLKGSNAGLADAYVGKFDKDGNQLWIRQFGSETQDGFGGVSVDQHGNVFVSGSTSGRIGTGTHGTRDALTIKLDSDGNPLWIRQWAGLLYAGSGSVQADEQGGAYFTGSSPSDQHENGGGRDGFVGRYDPDGNLSWVTYASTPEDDGVSNIALLESNDIVITGTTVGVLGDHNSGRVDSFLASFDGDGVLQWLTQYGSAETDSSSGLAVDALGGIYVSGLTRGSLLGPHLGGGGDAFLIKYSSLTVPEPSTVTLIMLASLGVSGRARHRR